MLPTASFSVGEKKNLPLPKKGSLQRPTPRNTPPSIPDSLGHPSSPLQLLLTVLTTGKTILAPALNASSSQRPPTSSSLPTRPSSPLFSYTSAQSLTSLQVPPLHLLCPLLKKHKSLNISSVKTKQNNKNSPRILAVCIAQKNHMVTTIHTISSAWEPPSSHRSLCLWTKNLNLQCTLKMSPRPFEYSNN